MSIKNKTKKTKGFTLTELLVTILIAGILMVYALPSFSNFIKSQNVINETNDLVTDLTFARVEALNTGIDTVVEPMDQGDWMTGRRIYADNDGDGSFSGADELLRVKEDIDPGLNITGAGSVGFDNQGASTDDTSVRSISIEHSSNPAHKVVSVALSGLITTKEG